MEIALIVIVIAIGTTTTLSNVSSENSKHQLCVGFCIESEFEKTQPITGEGIDLIPEVTLDLEEKILKVE